MFKNILLLVLSFTGLLIILYAIFISETARLIPIGLLLTSISVLFLTVGALKKSNNKRG